MSKIHASSEVIRQMKSDLTTTTKELNETANKVKSAINSSSDWNDPQGKAYRGLMQKIARLIESPGEPLEAAKPKLDRLAQVLDKYGKVFK